jgi:flotillin
MFGYRRPATNEAMLISGGRHGQKAAPFRVVTGHGAFVMPIFQKVRYLTLAMQEAQVAELCATSQNITLKVCAAVTFKVGSDPESIIRAAQRFLSDQQQMPVQAGRIFAAHLRPVIGSMTIEEIVHERRKLATEVLNGSMSEMAAIGLTADSLRLQSIDDMGAGYIKAMAAPIRARIIAEAQAAQARADQARAAQQAAEAQQDSEGPS